MKFSKTRIVYYDNQINKLVINKEDIKINEYDVADTSGYGVANLEGNVHNWNMIPTNYWGLYMSENEMYYAINSSSKIIPKSINVTCGHTIPIAKYPGAGTTTQLSFNNTIYSLIYELHDTEMVLGDQALITSDRKVFFKTYDGGRADNLHRLSLGKPDLWYKFPKYYVKNRALQDSDFNLRQAFVDNSITKSNNNLGQQEAILRDKDLAIEYLPEF